MPRTSPTSSRDPQAPEPYDCPKCTHTHPRGCHGHSRVRGEDYAPVIDPATGKGQLRPCRKSPMRGQIVCDVHGGRAKQNKAAAEVKYVEEQVTNTLGRLRITPVTNPLAELAEHVGRVKAWMLLLEDRVTELSDVKTRLTDSGFGGSADADRVHAEIVLYERAMAEFGKVLVAAARANIDERLAKIDEKVAAAVLESFSAGLAAIGVGGEQATTARAAAARHLRSVRTPA